MAKWVKLLISDLSMNAVIYIGIGLWLLFAFFGIAAFGRWYLAFQVVVTSIVFVGATIGLYLKATKRKD